MQLSKATSSTSNGLTTLLVRSFGQTERQRERKLKNILGYHHKDFTKNSSFKDHMKRRVDFFKGRLPLIPLSKMAHADPKTVSRKRRPYMVTSALLGPKIMKHTNAAITQQATNVVQDIWDKEGGSLRNKFFVLDHTAEVLENYRRIQENLIFSRVLFDEREKKAFLKKEGRQIENLIDNYEQKFGGHKYFEATDLARNDIARLHGSKTLFLEDDQIRKNLTSRDQKAKPGDAATSHALLEPSSAQILNEHKEYKRKQKELQNKRIDKLLTSRKNNPELQKYLEEKSHYDTASLGETSADELALKSGEDSAGSIDIVRTSTLTKGYDQERQLAAELADYEQKVVDQYHNLDVYRAKGKEKAKISFTDLTLQENLNYIKYNLKNSDEAFKMFEITQRRYEANPEIPASMIQKLGTRSSLKPKDVETKLIARYEYKNMLRAVQKNLEYLDNKQVVDTLYSVGRLHKGVSSQHLKTNFPDFHRYFTYFIKDMMKESKERIKELQPVQVAYLSKAITNLRKVLDDKNSETELQLREAIKDHAIAFKDQYDPYSISKVLRYLFNQNDGTAKSIEVFQALGQRFLLNLQEREQVMKDMPFDDPLIDVDVKDIVDMVRVYSLFSKPKGQEDKLFVPQLFSDEGSEAPPTSDLTIRSFEGLEIPTSIQPLSKLLLEALPEIIKKKESQMKFANVSDLMYHYIQGDIVQNKKFIYYLEKLADDQLLLKEEFNTLNSAKLLWGFGKFMNKTLAPGFAQQVSSSLINRFEFSKSPSINHRLQKKVVDQIFSRNKVITPDNFALTLYACASVGYYDKQFFDSAITQFKESGQLPTLKNLGYVTQAMTILRKNDYVPQLIDWMVDIVKEKPELFLAPSDYLSSNDFSFAQVLQGLAFLNPDKALLEPLQPFLSFYYHQLSIDLSLDHAQLAPSIAWSSHLLTGAAGDSPLIKKTDDLLIRSQAFPLSRLSFTDLVLLKQLSPHLTLNPEQQTLARQMTYRHDQMELKANILDYTKYQGADIVGDFVQSLKFLSYSDTNPFEITRFNPERLGYLQLVDVASRVPFTVVLENKLDVLNDTQTVNGYEVVRRRQMEEACQRDDRQMMRIGWKRLAAMYKGSGSKEEYRAMAHTLISQYL